MKFRNSMPALNKISEYQVEYQHDDDCAFEGCPGHYATFKYSSTSETFSITLDNQEIGLDSVEMRLIWDYIKKLTESEVKHG